MTIPRLDPTLAAALAVHGTPGAYALLLGSGVSRSAGVPTGWEVVEDLIRRVAALQEADAGTDPAAWYRQRFGAPPSYSALLETLALTPAERRELLRRYFEPTAEEREAGLKLPTRAHRAVARLIAGGYVRVVLTTNFDQLLESALRGAGVTPAVISTSDAVSGAMPLQFERVTLIKLHGDYLDTRIKNTPEELAAYDPALDRLLDRVLDEYGLIVCGWSGSWDTALRAALERCPTRRFTTFWAAKGAPAEDAARLIALRRAAVVPIESADEFFEAVEEKVTSLQELARPHPTSLAVTVATAKRYLPVPEHRIRLDDLVTSEVELLHRRALDIVPTEQPTEGSHLTAITQLEAAAATLMALLAAGAYWGEAAHRRLWVRAIERLGNAQRPGAAVNYVSWQQLLRYPGQLAFYAAGLGAVARGEENTLADVLLEPRLREFGGGGAVQRAAEALHLYAVIDHDAAKRLPGLSQRRTPTSDHLFEMLREPLREAAPDDEVYADLFDRFEYLVALAFLGTRQQQRPDSDRIWAPIGRSAWRHAYGRLSVAQQIEAEIKRERDQWFLLRRGLFDGSPELLLALKAKMDELRGHWGYY